jgi:putative ABC transport system permease protein
MIADLRHALRGLAGRPGSSVVAVLTLALGIGATTAIFSVVDGVLLRATPVVELDRLVMVWETDRHTGTTREPASVPDFLDFQRDSRTLAALEGVIGGEVNFAPPQGDPVRLAALVTSRGLLPMLGVAPIAGRTFTVAEDAAKGPKVALISESLWTRSFGRAPQAIGGAIRLDEETYTVVGVMPDQADFGMLQILGAADYSRGYADRGDRATADVWLPLQADVEALPRSTHPILLVGRLAPGASVSSAQAELTRLSAALERGHRENDGRGAFVEPLDAVVFGQARPALLMLWGAVGVVLLIGCVNVANLLLIRGRGRAREVAVRLALGAGVWRLARQFLLENLVLTLTGAVVGVVLAVAALRALLALAPPSVPRLDAVALDGRVLALTLGLSMVTGVIFGLVPLLQAWRLDPQATLKSEGLHGASTGRSGRRTQRVLVAGELALAVMLLIGAALLVRSFSHVMRVDAGFHTTGVIKAEYQLPASRYPMDFSKWPNLVEVHAFTARLVQRASQLPGVDAVAVSGTHPLDPGFTNSFQVVGREAEAANWPELSIRSVTPSYFRVIGLPLARGRLLRDADTTAAAPVLVINQAAAARFFEGREPLGAQIRFWGVTWTIVGVVANEKFQGVTEADPIAAYAPLAQAPTRGTGVLLVRAAGDPAALGPAIGAVVREIDPGLAVFGVEPLDDTLLRSVGQQRFAMILLALFAGLALVLAVIGVHGVLSYGVTERRRELGIRVALGAASRQITWLVVREGLVLTAAGIAVGIAGALIASRALSSLLFGVGATDASTYAAVAAALAGVALTATLLPARRATHIDPAQLLRD